MSYQYQPLLETKLHRPRLPHDLILRQQLTEWLDRDADRPLTLVCAPAGFGKTTLIATWIERMVAGPGNSWKRACRPHGYPSMEMIAT